MNDENHLQFQCLREDLLALQTLNKQSDAFHHPVKAKTAVPVAEWLRSLTSVLLIIRSSHRCGFAPRTGHEFICETSHVLLAGVSGGFSPGTPVFAPPTD